MKIKFPILILLIGSLLFSYTAQAQEKNKSNVVIAIEQGDAKTISAYFDDKVELGILDIKNFYSKSQAEIILRDFFKENPPSSFAIQHKGGKDNNQFFIGIYKSGENSYRIYYHLRVKDGKNIIPLFKVEKNKR